MNRRGFFRKAAGAVAAGAVVDRRTVAASPVHVQVESSPGVVTAHDVRQLVCDVPELSFDEGIWLDPRFVKQMKPVTVTLEWAPEVEYEMVLQPKTRK